MYDAEFHAFQMINRLAKRLLPDVRQYTIDQCDAIHEYARILAEDLTSGAFEYNAARHAKASKGVYGKHRIR
jgi:hypothetical protein